MMRLAAILLIQVWIISSCAQDAPLEPDYYSCDNSFSQDNMNHPYHEKYTDLIEEMVSSGSPGIMMTVKDEVNGFWSGAAGKADIANNIDLAPCNITRVGSTVKTFTAVTIFLLKEEGKLSLDHKITMYLSAEYLKDLANADQVTIRQLLQHSSGIYNYITNLKFQTASLNDLTKTWHPEELLAYARNKPANFAPGTDVQYSNTNYILLGEIISTIEKKPFYKVFEERLFLPLNLSFTRFAAEDPVPDGIIRGYVDFYSNLNIINATYYSGWDYFTADGGLISNSYDLNTFLSALFEGEILTQASMNEMLTWEEPKTQDPEGFETFYGLGIFMIVTEFGPAYIHSGDAIGYFASMTYFPNQRTTISWAGNGNYGSIDQFTQSKEAMNKIFGTVLQK